MLKKTSILSIVLLVLLGLILFGGDNVVADDRPFEGVELSIIVHPTVYEALGGGQPDGTVRTFERETGAQVSVTRESEASAIQERLLLEWTAQTGAYDLAFLYSPHLMDGLYRFLEPLNEYIEQAEPEYQYDDILQGARNLVEDNGTVYALPIRFGGGVLYYREDLFEEHEISELKTFEDMIEAARKLTLDTTGDGEIDIHGLLQRGGDIHVTGEDFFRYLYALGGRVLNEEGNQSMLGENQALEVLSLWKDLLDEGVFPSDMASIGRDEQVRRFQIGRTAMTIAFAPYYDMFTDPEDSEVADVVGWSPVPTAPGVPFGTTYGGAWTVLVDGASRNKEAAAELALRFSNKENQLLAAKEFGNTPTRLSSYEDEEYREMYPPADTWAQMGENVIEERHHRLPQIESAIYEEIHNVLSGAKTPEDAADAMHQRVQAIVE